MSVAAASSWRCSWAPSNRLAPPPPPPHHGRRTAGRCQASQQSQEQHQAQPPQQPAREQRPQRSNPWLPRRALLAGAVSGAVAAAAGAAYASKLPEAVDRAWEGLGGGPADLVFPESFLGVWDVESVLTSLDLPLGPEFVPDMRSVQRAQQQDLGQVTRYQVAFLQNPRGEVVPDRSFNTASLLQQYVGAPTAEVQRSITWDVADPNQLQLTLPGGLQVSTRVTRRSEERPAPDRLATSEYFQQLIVSPSTPQPKVKASQCFTRYKWRSEAAAAGGGGGGVQVVASQVVADFLTAFDDPARMMASNGQPVVVYNYKLAFRRPLPAGAAAAGDAAEAAAASLEGVPPA